MASPQYLTFQVKCCLQKSSCSHNFNHFKTLSSAFKPFQGELHHQLSIIRSNVSKTIKDASVKLLDAFVDRVFEITDQPLPRSQHFKYLQSNFAPVDELGEAVLITSIEGEIPNDFPEDYSGIKNKYGYTQVVDFTASSASGMPKFGGLAKLYLEEPADTEGLIKMEYHKFEENVFFTGSAFVSKGKHFEEDDGWTVTFVHNEDTDTSQVSQKWLKTNAGAGYRSPDQCCLFDAEWKRYLKPTDGPFIDETFYGSEINSYRKELNSIGVILDVGKECSLLASNIDLHTDLVTITRIYNFLAEIQWEADAETDRRIWILDGSENGQWVNPTECVLYDKDGLFSSQLYVLDKHYNQKLLEFFASAFDVKSIPTVGDFCKLWKVWESSGLQLSSGECCAFWVCVMRHWSLKTEALLVDCLVKLPVDSGSEGILLFDRRDVFIADDQQLKDAFEQSSCRSIFVWYPRRSLPALPRPKLLEIFSKIGVRTISESVEKQELSLEGVEFKQVKPRDMYIDKALVKLILGFLCNPALKLEATKRYEAVKCLQNLSVQEIEEPIEERYSLSLASGEIVNVRLNQMIRWDRKSSILFTQRLDRSNGHKNLLEYATHFSEVISKGVLWEMEDHINALAELIRLAFLLEFNEEAIGFLIKSKNLQIFMEDEEFLSTAFPSE
ncbi:hypothetical protein LWI28_001114 [Acer negundo]|uniref:Uncharacterized protein n=1 Tax=Acer negundo TaxID=4023 RepID=A0AAD5I500_ACENE|nr:hypothetical protein LWI28_001114 [Acer negundo]